MLVTGENEDLLKMKGRGMKSRFVADARILGASAKPRHFKRQDPVAADGGLTLLMCG